MKKTIALFTTILSIFFLFSFNSTVSAQNSYINFVDGANLLSDTESTKIIALLDEYSEKNGFNMIILTTNSLTGNAAEDTSYYDVDYIDSLAKDYSEAYYLSQGFDYETDGLVFLRYINEYDYYIRITSFGELRDVFDDSTANDIIDVIIDDLGRNSNTVFDGFSNYIYLADKTYSQRNDLTSGSILVSLGIALAISLIIVMKMKSQLKSVKNQNFAKDYLKKGSFNLTTSKDTYLYHTVSKVKIQSNSSSGGRSGGRSGGGGGGGRRG